MRADYHMHTSFSYDSDSSPEEMIHAAIQKGLQTIFFYHTSLPFKLEKCKLGGIYDENFMVK